MIDPHPTIGRAINVEFGVNLLMHISYTYCSTHNKLPGSVKIVFNNNMYIKE